MGLFGFKKKSQVQESNEFNSGLGTGFNDPMAGTLGNGRQQQIYDPMDPNSGLKLADLNSQDLSQGMPGSQGGLDSFGNPRPQQKSESYDYGQRQSMPVQDNSKDLQIIIAKLDAIRSEITNINHRLDNIERTQKETPQKKYPW